MTGTKLGAEQYRRIHDSVSSPPPSRKKLPWYKAALRWVVVLFMGLSAALSVGAGRTAEAGLWDLGEEMVANIMNVCNPNEVRMYGNPQGLIDKVLGTAPPTANSQRQGGADSQSVAGGPNLWSTYNPQVNREGTSYLTQEVGDESLSRSTVTLQWIKNVSYDVENKLYFDIYRNNYIPFSGDITAERRKFTGLDENGSVTPTLAQSYIVNPQGKGPESYNALAALNGPTVALQIAYQDAPDWVINPTYARYGFDALNWTTYGASCYDPDRYFIMVPEILYVVLITIPTLVTFGVIRISLGSESFSLFYELTYPITSIMGQVLQPWAFLAAVVIGLPFVWIKSKGSIGPLLGALVWVGFMFLAFTQFTNHTREITQFSQGVVTHVSGNMSCSIANVAFKDINSVAKGQKSEVPIYDENGNYVIKDGKIQTQEVGSGPASEKGTEDFINMLMPGVAGDNGSQEVSLDSMINGAKGKKASDTPCGSYMDSIYNAFWVGIPLQIWAEGQVGSNQAARDRSAQAAGKIGWYQAFLNAMYVNPEDAVGKAQIQATNRWNEGGYTGKYKDSDVSNGGVSKLAQWTLDGEKEEKDGATWTKNPVTPLDKNLNATPWKTVPFLLNMKLLCKDSTPGAFTEDKIIDIFLGNKIDIGKAVKDYSSHKWLYDGMCIRTGYEDVISAVQGKNNFEKIFLVLVGGVMAIMVFFFTLLICIYIMFQKFVWGWMLMFSPAVFAIAMFPATGQKAFAWKYGEFMLANVVKQIVAVMVLVITMLALARIVFPDAITFAGVNIGVPFILRPIVALAFLLSAVLFFLPLKRLFMAGVKGDAQKGIASITPKEVAKSAGKAAFVAGGAIGATYVGASALANGGARTLAASAANMAGKGLKRKSFSSADKGLTGMLKKGAMAQAGEKLTGLGTTLEDGQRQKANALGIDPAVGKKLSDGRTVPASLLDRLQRDKAIKNGEKNLNPMGARQAFANSMALEANREALKNGEALPYQQDANGKLTALGQKKALEDLNQMGQGNFRADPQFTATTRNKALNGKKFEEARKALLPQFTDKDGNVDWKALDEAAHKSVAEQNAGLLDRQGKIADDLLALDAQRAPEARKYLDADGKLTSQLGASKLISDAKMLDAAQTKLNNEALANSLMAENPEKYAALNTPENPNAGREAALREANEINYGLEGRLQDDVATRSSLAEGSTTERLPQSKAYVHGNAPAIGENGMTREGASALAASTATQLEASDPQAAEALRGYSEVLANPNASESEIREAHAQALTALANSEGLTPELAMVAREIQAPLAEGAMVAPNAARLVADSLESSPAVQMALLGYADAVEMAGADSQQAILAEQALTKALADSNMVAYGQLAQEVVTPASFVIGDIDSANQVNPVALAGSTATVPLMGEVLSVPAISQSIDPVQANEAYREALRSHYGLTPNSSLDSGVLFTPEELAGIESGSILPVEGFEDTGLARVMNLASEERARVAQIENMSRFDAETMRDAYREQLGFHADGYSADQPLLSEREQAMFQQRQEQERIKVALGTVSTPEISEISLEEVMSTYTQDVRAQYGLEESAKVAFGAALTPSEVRAIDSGELRRLAEVAYENAKADVPVLPADVRVQARQDVGLGDDGRAWSDPVFTYEETEALNVARDLGVKFSGGHALAPEEAQGFSINPAFYSSTSDISPLSLNMASQEQIAKAFASRQDGTSYVNGVVVTPHSDAPVVEMAAMTLPESSPERASAMNYVEAVRSGDYSTGDIESMRQSAVASLGAVPTEGRSMTDALGGILGAWSHFKVRREVIDEQVPSDQEVVEESARRARESAEAEMEARRSEQGQLAKVAIEKAEKEVRELEEKLASLSAQLMSADSVKKSLLSRQFKATELALEKAYKRRDSLLSGDSF